MDGIELSRSDLITVGSTARNTCRAMPHGKKHHQRVAIGDNSGQVTAIAVGKAGEIVQSFSTNVNTTDSKKGVSAMDMCGERVFVSCGTSVVGINKKGADFYRLDTVMSDNIQSFRARTPYIWAAGNYVLNTFDNSQETTYYLSPDKINNIVVDNLVSEKGFDIILGCQDRKVRCAVEKSDVQNGVKVEEFGVEGGVLTVQIYSNIPSTTKDVIYGTDNGVLGAFRTTNTLTKKWDFSKADNRVAAGFSCITCFDFTKDGSTEMIVGRDNGLLEIYHFQPQQNEPQLVYQTTLKENITSIDYGQIVTSNRDDIVVATFSGKVMAFAAKSQDQSLAMSQSVQQSKAAKEEVKKKNEKKIVQMKADIEKMKERLKYKTDEYKKTSEDLVPTVAETAYKVMEKYVLEDNKAYWTLNFELECPIESVTIVSDVDIEFMDLESNPSIVSRSIPEKDTPTKIIAVYRNTEQSNRMEIHIRTAEGQYGKLNVFILSSLVPKAAQLCVYDVKPLSLHHRLTEKPENFDSLVLNTITITGAFQMSEINTWVEKCLPEVPKISSEEAVYYFRSTFQGTILLCKYRAGEAVFKSDNVSTLAVLREFITTTATTQNKQIKTAHDIKDETCARVLELLHEKLHHQIVLSEKVKLIKALQEIEMQEQDVSFLTAEYKEILVKAKQIEKDYELQPRRLEFLNGIVRNLLIDKYKFKAQSAGSKLQQLDALLAKYELGTLKDFFSHP